MASIVSESYNGNGNARKNVTKEQMAQGVATGNTVPPLVVQSVADRMSAQGNPTDFTGMAAPTGWGSNASQPQQSVQQPMVVPTNVFSSGGNVLQGRFENVPATGDISARQQQIMGSNVFAPQQGYANVSPQNQTDFTNMPSPYSGNGWGSKPISVPVNGRAGELNYGAQNNVPGVVNPSLVSNNNLSALQAALQGATGNAVDYQKDKTKRDGGFSQWIKNTFGVRGPMAGESEEEYDYRTTQNKKRLMALADAMRHFGNIYNTTRYAPVQKFNSPLESVEKDYQKRSALRQAKAKQDADNAYKQYKLEQDAAKNALDAQFKNTELELKKAGEARAAARDKELAAYRLKQLDQQEQQAQRNYELALKKAKTDADYKKAQVALAKERNAISRQKNAILRQKANGSGGAGGVKNPYVINGLGGRFVRGRDLTSVNRQGAVQKMKNLKMLRSESTPGSFLYRLKTAQDAGQSQEIQNAIIDGAIADFAMRDDPKSKQFQKYLINNLGYTFVKDDKRYANEDSYSDLFNLFDEDE